MAKRPCFLTFMGRITILRRAIISYHSILGIVGTNGTGKGGFGTLDSLMIAAALKENILCFCTASVAFFLMSHQRLEHEEMWNTEI